MAETKTIRNKEKNSSWIISISIYIDLPGLSETYFAK